jgi:hypothetical protein
MIIDSNNLNGFRKNTPASSAKRMAVFDSGNDDQNPQNDVPVNSATQQSTQDNAVSISGKALMLSRLSPASDGGSMQEAASAQPADNLPVSDLASAFARKNEQTRAALDQLGQSSAESKREYARKRLKEIEDMLRQLMMLGLSPRQLSDLMKEVKGLVEQYQAAGNALNTSAPTASAGTSDVAQSSDNSSATGEAGDVSETAAAQRAASSDASLEMAAPATGEPTGASPDDALSPGSDQSSLTSAYREIVNNLSSRDAASKADIDFMTHAKNLLTRLRAMLKHADAQRAHAVAASS